VEGTAELTGEPFARSIEAHIDFTLRAVGLRP
jgi:hypothetical protein